MEIVSIVLFYLAYMFETVYSGDCALYHSIPGIVTCLSNITDGINSTNVLAGTDTATIRMYCEDGFFKSSIDCLEDFYRVKDECSTDQGGLHSLMRNNLPGVLSHSVQTLCASLPEHAKYSDCIIRQRARIQSCLRQNLLIFQQKQSEIPQPPTVQSVAYNMCRYYKGIEVCTGKYVENRCDKKMGILIGQFMSSVNPLNCSSVTSLSSSSSTSINKGGSIFSYISILVLVTCFMRSYRLFSNPNLL